VRHRGPTDPERGEHPVSAGLRRREDLGAIEAIGVVTAMAKRIMDGNLPRRVSERQARRLLLERKLAAFGAELCSRAQLLELQHLILSHHGSLEFGSPVRPLTAEAEIVHRADDASAKSADITECLADGEAFRDGEAFGDKSRLWRVERRSLWRKAHDWD
jgi:hypothetical protein